MESSLPRRKRIQTSETGPFAFSQPRLGNPASRASCVERTAQPSRSHTCLCTSSAVFTPSFTPKHGPLLFLPSPWNTPWSFPPSLPAFCCSKSKGLDAHPGLKPYNSPPWLMFSAWVLSGQVPSSQDSESMGARWLRVNGICGQLRSHHGMECAGTGGIPRPPTSTSSGSSLDMQSLRPRPSRPLPIKNSIRSRSPGV